MNTNDVLTKLIAEIERYKQGAAIARFDNAGENADYFQGKVDLCDDLTHIITSLQQEQPEVEFEDKFANFLERKDAELGANSWSEEDLRELAEYFYFNNKQPEVDLDALVNEAFDKYSSVDGYGQLSVSFNRAELYSFIKKIARKEE